MVATEMSDCLLVFDQVGMGWFLSWALGGEGGHVCGSWRCRDGGRGSVSVGRTQLVHVEVGDHLTRDFSQHRLGQSFFRRLETERKEGGMEKVKRQLKKMQREAKNI